MQRLLSFLALTLLIFACQQDKIDTLVVASPSNNITIEFLLTDEGKPAYRVSHLEKMIIETSTLGFNLKEQPALNHGFEILQATSNSIGETWEMPWGEQRKVINEYNELIVQLQESNANQRQMTIHFKAYDEGIAFRYEFPEQDGFSEILIIEENTQFKLTGDHTTWWIPGDWDIYEHLYNTSKLSKINALEFRNHEDLNMTYIPENAVNTPVTMRTEDGLHLSFHEASLVDYAGMTLKVDTTNLNLKSVLVGSERTDYKVKRKLPFNTPWRTIQISPDAAGLIESNLIVNLNEPNKIGNVDWFQPMKYMGIWWEMHVGISSWDLKQTQDMTTVTKEKSSSKKHGATTANAKKFIDFASENNIKGLLIEGWNTGWSHWIGFEDREGVFDFVTPYEDYDLQEVVRYGKEKGVDLIMHHETSSATKTYEQQMDTAYALMKSLDIHAVKSGYVGSILPKGEYHHGQWMVNHFNNAVIKAAAYEVAVNAHEPIKATGLRRTYPNMIAREGVRGQEFNAWASDGGNPPEHLSIVAFTRMLSGPIDFTPGIFNIKLNPYKENNQINTTLAHQLALYVVIYSPIQMAADLIENYQGKPAFQFIKDVGVDWEQTKVLNGEVGDFVTIAREERESKNWFVGGITDENERIISVNFDFLAPDKKYKAIVYSDGTAAHWNENPTSIKIDSLLVDHSMIKDFHLASGGGFAISLMVQ